MLKKFYTSAFDNEILLLTDDSCYSYKTVKSLIISAIEIIQNKKQNIVISEDNNLNFIIKFMACIFAHKNIYLVSDRKKIKDIEVDFDLFDECNFYEIKKTDFPQIDTRKIIINFLTSGSTAKAKIISKSLYNLIKEAEDLGTELKLKDLTAASTTTMCHLFGMTFHLMYPLVNSLKIYTPSILYADKLKVENLILVSTPAFLNTIEKYKTDFPIAPKYIITAGSKLNDTVFEYLENKTNIIEIYGSTETGVIAHKEHFNERLNLFKNVEIKVNEDNIEVQSPYIYEGKTVINDKAETDGRSLIIKNRTDRIFKIQDKRISAEEIENNLKEHEFINECYITQNAQKLACICVLSKSGQNFLIENGMLKLTKYLKNHIKNYSEIFPQKWKFIDIIPRTQTGKINKELINHIFNLNLSFPVILNRNEIENKIEYEILFYKSCNFFNGHFPEFKILPGIVQLYFAKEFANIHFNLELGQGQWKKIKFSNIILPDSIVKLNIEKKEKYVEYKFFDDSKIYSSGMFMGENVFKELQCI